VPIGWNLPTCDGSGLIGRVLDAAGAGGGYDRPEGSEIEIEIDVVDYISDLIRYMCVPGGNLTAWDGKGTGLRLAWPPSAYVTVGDSYTASKASSPGRQRAVAICPGINP
jgi:hypothetical protein